MADPIALLRTAVADRYVIERELGRGGMATVFLAQDLRHRRTVAVRLLRAELAGPIGPERFLREIEIAAGLCHPHILPLFDSGSSDGLLYYVMPFIEGESLRQRLDRERQLPIEDALRITREVGEALGYAHSLGFVHRDIKPANILLSHSHAVVADFTSTGISFVLAALGHACAAAGQPERALELLRELDARGRERYVPAYDRAVIYAGLNQIDPPLEWLQRAHEERSSWISYLKVEPRLDPLRSDPRFAALFSKVGLE